MISRVSSNCPPGIRDDAHHNTTSQDQPVMADAQRIVERYCVGPAFVGALVVTSGLILARVGDFKTTDVIDQCDVLLASARTLAKSMADPTTGQVTVEMDQGFVAVKAISHQTALTCLGRGHDQLGYVRLKMQACANELATLPSV